MNLADSVSSLSKVVPTIDGLADGDLIKLRSQIENRLELGINEIDLDVELSLQYRHAKALYADVAEDEITPTNQKAQVLNTISNILKQITETMEKANSITRHKKIEAATLLAVKDLPLEAKKKFFDTFKEYLDESGASVL